MFATITFIHAITIQNKLLSNLIIHDQHLGNHHVVTAHNFLVTERVRNQRAVRVRKSVGKTK